MGQGNIWICLRFFFKKGFFKPTSLSYKIILVIYSNKPKIIIFVEEKRFPTIFNIEINNLKCIFNGLFGKKFKMLKIVLKGHMSIKGGNSFWIELWMSLKNYI